MKINSDAIRELSALLNETGLTEIEVCDDGKSIRVSKAVNVIATSGGASEISADMSRDPAARQKASMDTGSGSLSDHPGAILSPMVGTVYLQSEPGSPPFVQKGGVVSVGDQLVIIEAMKVMNPIRAEKPGTVVRVCVENGQPVEYGDVLMIIE